jgi:uncharacterized membrane protein
MALNTIVGVSVVALILIIALYVWTFIVLARKWRYLTPAGVFLYVVLGLLCPGVGPVPILILLYLDVGVDQFHSRRML